MKKEESSSLTHSFDMMMPPLKVLIRLGYRSKRLDSFL
jgi:hypothetical protein